MDIKERIESVIERQGLTKKTVCERMGKFDQAFNSLMKNPKWTTIEAVADAIGIQPWQLFMEEIEAAGYRAVTRPAPAQGKAEDTLPFQPDKPDTAKETHAVETQQAIICPNCGKPMVISVKS